MNIRNISGILYLDYYILGKRCRRSTKLPDTKQNRKYVEKKIIPKIQAKIILGEFGPKKVGKLEHYCRHYLEEKQELVSYPVKKSRIESFLGYFGNVPVDRITRGDVKRFLGSLECSNITKKEYLTDLRGVINVAVDDEVIERNPCEGLKPGRIEAPDIDPFTAGEIDKILAGCSDPVLRNYLGIGFHLGLRSGEIIGLMHTDFEGHTVHIQRSISKGKVRKTKTRESDRVILVLDAARPYIEDQMRRSNSLFLFHRKTDHLYDAGSFRRPWLRLLGELGIRHRVIYNTRHSFITALLNSGTVPVLDIAKYVGNSPKVIFKNYAGWVRAERIRIDTAIDLYGLNMGTVRNDRRNV